MTGRAFRDGDDRLVGRRARRVDEALRVVLIAPRSGGTGHDPDGEHEEYGKAEGQDDDYPAVHQGAQAGEQHGAGSRCRRAVPSPRSGRLVQAVIAGIEVRIGLAGPTTAAPPRVVRAFVTHRIPA